MSYKTPPVIGFFNNKGGIGKTTLVLNTAWHFAKSGNRVLACDFDPQSNLTTYLLGEERYDLILSSHEPATIMQTINPIIAGKSNPHPIEPQSISENFLLLPGDINLASVEDKFAEAWLRVGGDMQKALEVTSAFRTTIKTVCRNTPLDAVLVDMGPSLGALNRAALLSCDFVIVPLMPELFSLRGLSNMGPIMRRWRKEWMMRRREFGVSDNDTHMPTQKFIGYVLTLYTVLRNTENTPAKYYQPFIDQIPERFQTAVQGEAKLKPPNGIESDTNFLGGIRHFHSFGADAQRRRVPISDLGAVKWTADNPTKIAPKIYADLCVKIKTRCGIAM